MSYFIWHKTENGNLTHLELQQLRRKIFDFTTGGLVYESISGQACIMLVDFFY